MALDDAARRALAELVRQQGYEFRDPPFQLTSGGWSHDYVDGKHAIATGAGLRQASQAVIDVIGRPFDAVGGPDHGRRRPRPRRRPAVRGGLVLGAQGAQGTRSGGVGGRGPPGSRATRWWWWRTWCPPAPRCSGQSSGSGSSAWRWWPPPPCWIAARRSQDRFAAAGIDWRAAAHLGRPRHRAPLNDGMRHRPLDEEDLDPDPIRQFRRWFDDAAAAAGQPEPEAMALATATPDGEPSVRFVLLRGVDERGFVFYTNRRSRKGRDLAANPRAAAGLPVVDRRAPGPGVPGRSGPWSTAESDAYFRRPGLAGRSWAPGRPPRASRSTAAPSSSRHFEDGRRSLRRAGRAAAALVGRISRPAGGGGVLAGPARTACTTAWLTASPTVAGRSSA